MARCAGLDAAGAGFLSRELQCADCARGPREAGKLNQLP